MVPPTFYRIPLFFDFSSPYPVSTVKLGRKQIGYASRLDGTLHVCFPESPRNMDIGMMMFTLEIVSRNDTIFYSRFRPTVLRYKDDLETKMETLTYFFLLLMGWKVSFSSLHRSSLSFSTIHTETTTMSRLGFIGIQGNKKQWL